MGRRSTAADLLQGYVAQGNSIITCIGPGPWPALRKKDRDRRDCERRTHTPTHTHTHTTHTTSRLYSYHFYRGVEPSPVSPPALLPRCPRMPGAQAPPAPRGRSDDHRRLGAEAVQEQPPLEGLSVLSRMLLLPNFTPLYAPPSPACTPSPHLLLARPPSLLAPLDSPPQRRAHYSFVGLH